MQYQSTWFSCHIIYEFVGVDGGKNPRDMKQRNGMNWTSIDLFLFSMQQNMHPADGDDDHNSQPSQVIIIVMIWGVRH